ncbi:hypothetical protein [Halomonas organivorans]|uniref:Uncharacterized protein n=1 Tax=Halomonas organivorans TaxID=257772 RepID=A0A7W5BW24_9GAMM|nr:hypothetical protein [Halomonas organivorans]MBB3140115.1 hypothetical protein [Halomonas organivorans]
MSTGLSIDGSRLLGVDAQARRSSQPFGPLGRSVPRQASDLA